MNDTELEQEIQAKSLTAPRVTPDDINASIVREHYFTLAQGVYGSTPEHCDITCFSDADPEARLTFCALVLRNGFIVTGESACASPENFNAELGRKIARQNAVDKLWPLLGYELRTKLAQQS